MGLLRKFTERHYFRRVIIYFSMCCLIFNGALSVTLAGPEGAEVVHGQVSFQQSGLNTTIHASDKSIINYKSFDIARPEVVQFVQPSSSASVLNRILSANPTNIDGTLLANGRVFFINPAGVIIGSGARINVNQLVASGLNISNDSFINGQYEFVGGGGTVANYGDIFARSVYLVGKQVTNVGNINCPDGYVVMAAGDRVFLGQPGSSVIVEIGSLEPPDQADAQPSAEITNEGTVNAAGGTIILAAAGDVFSRPIMANTGSLSTSNAKTDAGNISLQAGEGKIDNTGTITATSDSGAGGTITASASEVVNTGTVDTLGAMGGTVTLEGIDYLGQFGTVSADGSTGNGGDIDLRAGEVIVLGTDSLTTANAGANGNGGEVVASSPGAAFFEPGAQLEAKGGSESGDGGFLEVSGKEYVETFGQIDLTATNGESGMFLIDPLNLTIVDSVPEPEDGGFTGPNGEWQPGDTSSQLDIDILEGYLSLADVTLSTLGTVGPEEGDIIFDADRYLNSRTDASGAPAGYSFTVEAARNIEFTAGDGINFVGDGDVKLYAEGHITSVDRGTDTISTLRGDIIMEAGNDGSGIGIDVGRLTIGVPNLDYPGEIRLSTTDGGNITTELLEVQGNGYGSIYAFSSGNLTINGSSSTQGAVLISTNHVPAGADASSFVCLTAEKDVTINGDVSVGAHGKDKTRAGIWIGAGTNVQDPVGGYPGTVIVNGNLEAIATTARDAPFKDSEATIKVYAKNINLYGNKVPHAKADDAEVKTSITDSDEEIGTDRHFLASVDIDITKDGTCLNCGNVILPIALPDWLKESKNIMVYAIAVLANDEDGEGGPLIGGTVDPGTLPPTSFLGGTLTLNPDGTVQYEPPADWVFDDNGEFADFFDYYAVDADGDISAAPARVTIVLINQLPVADGGWATTPKAEAVDVVEAPVTNVLEFYIGSDADVEDSVWVSSYGTASNGSLAPIYEVPGDETSHIIGFTYEATDLSGASFNPSGYDDAFDSFSYTVTDGYNISTASPSHPGQVQINLTNQLPVANPDFYDVSHNVTLDITDIASGTIEGLIAGSEDTDPDPGDTLTASLNAGGTTALGGNVVLNTDGTFTYTPPANTANVDDSFTYYVTDSYNNSDPTTVTISLTNQLPVANPDFYDVSHNVTFSPPADQGIIVGIIPAINGDFDMDGDDLTPYLLGGSTSGQTTYNGTVTLNYDGSFTYGPPADWGGIDTFTYYVNDGYNNSAPVSVTMTVSMRTPTGEEASLTSAPVSPELGDIGQIEGTYVSDLLWLGEELGLCEGDQQGEDESRCQEITQAYLAGAFLQASDLRPHQAAAQLRQLAGLLHDTDGSRIAALGRVINEFAQPDVPPSPEQFASISQAFAVHVNDGTHYASAKEWLDALAEYTMLLISEIGWSPDDSVAFVMSKYGPTVTEAFDIGVVAFIQMHLEGLIG